MGIVEHFADIKFKNLQSLSLEAPETLHVYTRNAVQLNIGHILKLLTRNVDSIRSLTLRFHKGTYVSSFQGADLISLICSMIKLTRLILVDALGSDAGLFLQNPDAPTITQALETFIFYSHINITPVIHNIFLGSSGQSLQHLGLDQMKNSENLIRRYPNLVELEICSAVVEDMFHFAKEVTRMRSLRHLTFREFHSVRPDFNSLWFFAEDQLSENLHSLRLSNITFNPQHLCNFKNLKELFLEKCTFAKKLEEADVIHSFAGLTSLENLCLDKTPVKISTLAIILDSCSSLKNVVIIGISEENVRKNKR